ncbi:MAG: glycosyltransferase [Clostridia bacterium]|nr:glycosyltransferase [Clostridia bacterium]
MDNKKLKITVYAITKNEEKFIDKWVNSMSEADEIVVLDTGSTDKTVELLKKRGVKVTQKEIKPWRFDVARNESLKLVSEDTDVCVCTDLDEVFEKGWRKKIEENWKPNTKKLKYKYVWNVLPNGQDGTTFYYEKIHAPNYFKWVYPVHEVLEKIKPIKNEEIAICEDLVLRHYPDKEKSRGQYLPLLELAVKENPNNDRNAHYLAREYYFCGQYDKAITMFKKHLNLKSSTWHEERSASLRYMGDCYLHKNMPKKAKEYYEKAIVECFDIREPYLSLAQFYYNKNDYLNCAFVLENMLKINKKSLTYIVNPNCWNEYPYDMLNFCYYNLKQTELAYFYAQKALLINPEDKRLQNNYLLYKKLLEKNK